jgi:hypothetical protein
LSSQRSPINFENAFVTVVAFLALAGGVAYGAGHLAKSSVGKKQLKANAVTAKKIRANAVTGVKIRSGAVDGAKVADGAIGLAQLNSATSPFSGIVHTTASSPFGYAADGISRAVPLGAPAYVQQAGEADLGQGSIRVTFAEGCLEGPRYVIVILAYDEPNPIGLELNPKTIAAGGELRSKPPFAETATFGLTSFFNGLVPPPGAATNRTLYLSSFAFCTQPGSVNLAAGNFDLIGIR